MFEEHLLVPQEPEFTFRVLVYEIGNVDKLMIYTEIWGPVGYLGDLRAELGDAHVMLGLLSEQLGHGDIDNLVSEGLVRFKKRQLEKWGASQKK